MLRWSIRVPERRLCHIVKDRTTWPGFRRLRNSQEGTASNSSAAFGWLFSLPPAASGRSADITSLRLWVFGVGPLPTLSCVGGRPRLAEAHVTRVGDVRQSSVVTAAGVSTFVRQHAGFCSMSSEQRRLLQNVAVHVIDRRSCRQSWDNAPAQSIVLVFRSWHCVLRPDGLGLAIHAVLAHFDVCGGT